MMKYVILGVLFYCLIGLLIWFFRPSAKIHKDVMFQSGRKHRILYWSVCIITILICILPMGLPPVWNGSTTPTHHDQYERMTDAILDGHLYLDYEVDEKLLEMENPYDPQARKQLGVRYHWDHAFYNGKYYMYFGVIPVFLVFLPYRLITGTNLLGYHATQIFVAFFIFGFFELFRLLREKFFNSLNTSLFLLGCTAFSLMSVWYTVDAPSLYCTAISSALALEVWSLFFLCKAAYFETRTKWIIPYTALGALLGALAFGCRPPIALANIIAIPLFITILLKNKKVSVVLGKSIAIALPYAMVGVALMLYNYARFDNPFEFGQSYQLTVADQSSYTDLFDRINIESVQKSLHYFYFSEKYWGLLLTYPIITFACVPIFNNKSLEMIKEKKLIGLLLVLPIAVLLIIVIDAAGAPYPIPRYRLDFSWIIGISSFVCIGIGYENAKLKGIYSFLFSILAISTVFASIELYLRPYDANYTASCMPDILDRIKSVKTFGIL